MASNHDNESNYESFRDSVFTTLIAAAAPPSTGRKAPPKRRQSGLKPSSNVTIAQQNPSTSSKDTTPSSDPAELADFSDYIAAELFSNLPEDLRTLSHKSIENNDDSDDKWSLPLTLSIVEEISETIPPTVTDSLIAYNLINPPKTDISSFITPILSTYIPAVTAPPPKWSETRLSACEICDRDWIPITYHHLIPRGVHAKVLKRGWHDEDMLNSVAWLCRACHTFVHKMASNEELAREWYTVDKICERDDVRKWAQWIGRVRWKKT